MEILHAKYPFLSSARESVADSEFDLISTIQTNQTIVKRALERILCAIEEGSIGPEHRNATVELLSYPLARILVSLVDEPGLTHRYSWAESQTAISRFQNDLENKTELKSISSARLSLKTLLDELQVTKNISQQDDIFSVSVETYLSFVSYLPGASWKLVFQALSQGKIHVDEFELYKLLGVGIFRQIKSDLPLKVPKEAEKLLQTQLKSIHNYIDEIDLEIELAPVSINFFPPCMVNLLQRVESNERLNPPSLFSLTSFLISTQTTPQDIFDYLTNNSFHPSLIQSAMDYLQDKDGGPLYPPPSCATMQTYGDCVNMDDICQTISHPLQYSSKKHS
jgi:DNA primase large subunit